MIGQESQGDVGEDHHRHGGQHDDDEPAVDAQQTAVEGVHALTSPSAIG